MKLGLVGNTFYSMDKGLITGYGVATNDLLISFLRYSDYEKAYCLYEPFVADEAQIMDFLKSKGIQGKEIELVKEYDLLFRGEEKIPKVDILHSIKEDALPLLVMRELSGRKTPITFTVHSLAEQHMIMDFFYPMVFLPYKPYDAIICTSEAVRKSISEIFQRLEHMTEILFPLKKSVKHKIRLEKVPLGVDIDRFRPLEKDKCRKMFGFCPDEFIVLWFGRFSDLYKADLYPLLTVFERLCKNNPTKKLRLLLAGCQEEGQDYAGKIVSEAEHLGIADHVSLIFNHEIEDKVALYCACDVFTSPIDNVQETFGLTPVEAMACGVPQLVSDWDGYRDTVKDGVTGYLIKTVWTDCMDDVARMDFLPLNMNRRRMLQRNLQVRSVVVDCDDYYRKLEHFVKNPDLCKLFSENSRKRAVEEFSLENTVKKTEEIWKNLKEIAAEHDSEFYPECIPMIDYCNDFRGYPSSFIDDTKIFTITEYGQEKSVDDLLQYRIFNSLFEEAILPKKIMNYIKINEPVTMGNIIEHFSTFTKDQVRRETMHLYKYGMIR